MNDFPKSVVDEDGNIHHLLDKPLGCGGQGVVLRTRSPHIAVKLIGGMAGGLPDLPGNSKVSAQTRLWDGLTKVEAVARPADESKRAALRRRLEDVRALPLPDLHLAQPLAMLREHVGYTMRLLNDMVPIRSLIAPPGTDKLGAFYLESGGLRRRLELLANTAALFARLHAIPLVYADCSPNNVFVSKSHEANEVWLIDLDNLDYLSTSAAGIFTPGFGAPEVVTGRAGVTTLSDAFSFAVLAFYVLAQVHPFLGDYVEEAGWDSDEDREKLAFEGKIPWIDDLDDPSNRTARGIPRVPAFCKPVLKLFQRAFGPGRTQRKERPSMTQWVEVIRRATDRTVSCGNCGSTFDVTARTCPFCPAGPNPAIVHMQVFRWDPEIDDKGRSALGSKAVWDKVLDANCETTILRHVCEPVLADAENSPVLKVRTVDGGIYITPVGNYETYEIHESKWLRLDRERRWTLDENRLIYIHFGAPERPHRMAALRYYPGGA